MDIGKIVKNEPAYPNAEKADSKDLLGKVIQIKGFTLAEGDKGQFAIINADFDGKDISFVNGGGVVLKALKTIAAHFGIEVKEKPIVFKEAIECKFVEQKGKTGRIYNNLESLEEKKKE